MLPSWNKPFQSRPDAATYAFRNQEYERIKTLKSMDHEKSLSDLLVAGPMRDERLPSSARALQGLCSVSNEQVALRIPQFRTGSARLNTLNFPPGSALTFPKFNKYPASDMYRDLGRGISN